MTTLPSPDVVIARSAATRHAPSEVEGNLSGLSAPPASDDSATVEGANAIASPAGKTTLAEASRDRLARPIADRELWSEFEKATGETVDPSAPPTWAELIAAQQARRAAGDGGARDAKELRDAAEGSKNDPTRVAFLLSLDGLPRTTAVTGKRPA